MPFGGPQTANSLFRLADILGQQGERRRRHTLDMKTLDTQMKSEQAQRDISMAKINREEYLSQPVTVGEAIRTSKLPDIVKQRIFQTTDQKDLDIISTRKDIWSALRAAKTAKKESGDFTLGAGQVRYDKSGKVIAESKNKGKDTRTEIQKTYDRYRKNNPDYKGDILDFKKKWSAAGGKGTEKDSRTGRQKEFDRFKKTNPDYQGTIIDFKQAMEETDPIEMALKLAQNDMRSIQDPKKTADIAQEYLGHLKSMREELRGAGKKSKTDQITLPNTITKTSQALKYLQEKHGMDESQARSWIIENAGPQ